MPQVHDFLLWRIISEEVFLYSFPHSIFSSYVYITVKYYHYYLIPSPQWKHLKSRTLGHPKHNFGRQILRWLQRSFGERNVNLLQYSCLGNPMDRGDWWDTEWCKPERKTLIQYTNAYIWNLEKSLTITLYSRQQKGQFFMGSR